MTKYIPNMNAAAPFGFKHTYNGLDFSKSVTNRDSRLCRVVRYVRDDCVTPVSRKHILFALFPNRKSQSRGWGTTFFAGMIKAGFLDKVGSGNRVRYIEGRNSHLITR